MKENEIDPPPDIEKINDSSLKNLAAWINYFQEMSDKIKILLPDDEDFSDNLKEMKKLAIQICRVDPELGEKITGWPEINEIAFVICVNSANPSQKKPRYEGKDVRIFCFRDRAFALGYFSWDGDAEDDPSCTTFSLNSFTGNSLSWEYISDRILDQIKKLSQTVPEPP